MVIPPDSGAHRPILSNFYIKQCYSNESKCPTTYIFTVIYSIKRAPNVEISQWCVFETGSTSCKTTCIHNETQSS